MPAPHNVQWTAEIEQQDTDETIRPDMAPAVRVM
jgi:hypothetical protein